MIRRSVLTRQYALVREKFPSQNRRMPLTKDGLLILQLRVLRFIY
jgi:hypothetical protein